MSKFFHTLFLLSITSIFGQNIVLDNSFGNNGILELPFDRLITNGGGNAKSIMLENGQILVLQGGQIDGVTKSYLTKINQNGTIDTTFGTNGFIFFNYYTPYEFSIEIQNDNKIIVFGGHNPVKLYRFLENGQPDLEFGNNGLVLVTNVSNSYAHDTTSFNGERHNLLLLENGKILMHYKFSNLSTSGYKLKCFNSDGSPNASFGLNSELTKNNSSTSDYISEFFFESADNKILGYSSNNSSYTFEKLELDGTKDLAYGTNGINNVTIPFSNFNTYFICKDQYNRFLIQSVYNSLQDSKMIRIDSTGNIDTSFGINGIISATFNIQNLILSEPVIFENNYFFGGAILNSNFDSDDLVILKANDNGNLNQDFNNNGVYLNNTVNIQDGGGNIHIQNDGKIVIFGQYNIDENTRKIFIKKYINQSLNNQSFYTDALYFQNPISENLKFTSKKTIKKIEIFNSFGQKIIESKNTAIISSHFPKGIYLANIEFDDNTFTSKRLIKN